jgi:hypothetical protein
MVCVLPQSAQVIVMRSLPRRPSKQALGARAVPARAIGYERANVTGNPAPVMATGAFALARLAEARAIAESPALSSRSALRSKAA